VYAQRRTADLAANRRRQEELTHTLERLKTEEAWMLSLAIPQHEDTQTVPPSAPAAAEPATPEPPHAEGLPAPVDEQELEPAAVPPQRQQQAAAGTRGKKAVPGGSPTAKAKAASTKPAAGAKAPAKKTAAKRTANKPAAKKASGKPSGTAGGATAARNQPPLRELLADVMSSNAGEPLKVSEIRTLLETAHHGRATSNQVVRNTLEVMVEKGTVERSEQKGSVMYTLPAPTDTKADEPAEQVPAAV
jgi:hypothetical protein